MLPGAKNFVDCLYKRIFKSRQAHGIFKKKEYLRQWAIKKDCILYFRTTAEKPDLAEHIFKRIQNLRWD